MSQNLINVRVWGDFACFTRPEMKVERVSYPLITPSAARGILEAIFWKPEMFYLIDSIRVVQRGAWTSVRRNEITKRISLSLAKTAMNGAGELSPIQAGGGADDATQRNMLALQRVEYIITAEVRLTGIGRRNTENTPIKYLAEIERRMKNGKCFHRPALGVREFAADFDWEADADEALERRLNEIGANYKWNENFGLMLYDVFAAEERATGFKWLDGEDYAQTSSPLFAQMPSKKKSTQPISEGVLVKPSAAFFRAEIKNSVMDCHPDRIQIIHRNGGQS